jgi:fatty-acyl-CoA synthase
MRGLMQETALSTNLIFARGERYWSRRPIVTRTVTGRQRTTFGELATETRRTAGILDRLGLSPDARVGSFAWNTARHLQLYFAVPGTGRILHTINIRYFADQVVYTIDHAEDEAIFVERSLLPLFAPLLPRLDTVRHVVLIEDGSEAEIPRDSRIVGYDELLAQADEIDFADRITDEHQAAALCYTTGTTGNPKGVLYSHRSTWLHANAGGGASTSAITDSDNVLPVVPMFHAMAWGLPYICFMAGAALTMPGPDLSPAGLIELIESERVTYASGIPTLWMGMLPLLEGRDLSSINRMMCGGSAVPRALSEAWRAAIGVPITQGWGMTETSPVASMSTLRAELTGASEDEQADARAAAGIALPGIEMRIVDAATDVEQPWDDVATGEVQVRGPWVARQYYRSDEPGEQFTDDGWLRTGDVGAINELGYLRLVDRTKDLIKSGGEWLSSVELENAIMGHPAVAEAAVIAVAHPVWMERPLACVVVAPGEQLTKAQLMNFLGQTRSGWRLPEDIVFIDEVPKTSVGKFSKKTLRERYVDYVLPS